MNATTITPENINALMTAADSALQLSTSIINKIKAGRLVSKADLKMLETNINLVQHTAAIIGIHQVIQAANNCAMETAKIANSYEQGSKEWYISMYYLHLEITINTQNIAHLCHTLW